MQLQAAALCLLGRIPATLVRHNPTHPPTTSTPHPDRPTSSRLAFSRSSFALRSRCRYSLMQGWLHQLRSGPARQCVGAAPAAPGASPNRNPQHPGQPPETINTHSSSSSSSSSSRQQYHAAVPHTCRRDTFQMSSKFSTTGTPGWDCSTTGSARGGRGRAPWLARRWLGAQWVVNRELEGI